MHAPPQQQLYDAARQRRGCLRPQGVLQEDGNPSPQEATSRFEVAAEGLAGRPLAILGAAAKQSCLLGRAFTGEKAIGTTLKVKNTFIDSVAWDDEEDEEADLGPPMTAIKSCPVRAMKEDEDLWEELNPEQTLPCEEDSCWPSAVPEADSSPVQGAAFQAATRQEVCWQGLRGEAPLEVQFAPGVQQRFQQAADGSVLWPVIVVQAPAPQVVVQQPASLLLPQQQPGVQPPRQQPASPHVVPLEVRKPESSAGSLLHGTGECRPCAWFWRAPGCTNGSECRHCHMCLEGEVKTRRKTKTAAMRAQRAAGPPAQ